MDQGARMLGVHNESNAFTVLTEDLENVLGKEQTGSGCCEKK